jgi:endoglucanase
LFLVASSPLLASGLRAEGSVLKDENGNTVRLTGVNWFGMETSNMCPHGLWARDWKGMLLQIKGMGFNCIRLPFCNAILRNGATANSINNYGVDPFRKNAATEMNKELIGKSPLEIMDIIVAGCAELGIAVLLDDHSREPNGYMNELVWYTATTSEQQWIDDWVFLAERYKDNPFVVGCDLDNEPHGKAGSGGSQWGGSDPLYDWKSAAQRCGNAILAANPNILIVVEGVEQVGSTNYWWGGNLSGVRSDPIVLSNPQKLVYSPHEYGPEVFGQSWFTDPAFPANLPAIWDTAFAFIKNENKGHLLIGEFGIRDTGSFNGKEGTWISTLLSTLCKSISWTFWCMNPNSGDTGGLLDNDWTTPVQWKLDLLKPYMAPPLGSVATLAPQASNHAKDPLKGVSIVNGRIEFYGCKSAEKDLTISTVDGKTILCMRIEQNIVFIRDLGLAAGVYVIEARAGHTRLTGKFICSKAIGPISNFLKTQK